jgi:hypothetical protein
VNIITTDAAWQQLFVTAQGVTAVKDADGKLLGYFSPITREQAASNAEAASHFDPAEKNRRKHSSERDYTTAEVLEHLRSLEK